MDMANVFGDSSGIRIAGQNVSPLILNNTIVNNSVGFDLQDTPSPTIINNNIQNNTYYSAYLLSCPDPP